MAQPKEKGIKGNRGRTETGGSISVCQTRRHGVLLVSLKFCHDYPVDENFVPVAWATLAHP